MDNLKQVVEAAFWTGTRYRVRETALKLLLGVVMVAVWEGGQAWSQRQTDDVLGGVAIERTGCGSFVELTED